RKKLRAFTWLVLCAFFLLIARMWYLQIVKGDALRQRSESNRIRIQEIKPLRGLIVDSRGDILVNNQSSFDISIIPEIAKNPADVRDRLAGLFDRADTGLFLEETTLKSAKPFVPVKIARNIGRDKLAVVESHALNLPGVVVDIVPVREYIYGEMVAHLLGYVGEISASELDRDTSVPYRADDVVGKYGIEKYLDDVLKGKSGGEQVEVDAAGRRLNVLGRIDPVSGHAIVLNIDSDLQKVCWDAFKGQAGTVVVMEPHTGAVLAMVSKPSFDPNLFNRGISAQGWKELTEDPLCPLQNRAISGQYPPGSTYKLFVAAAALEEGLITENTEVWCNGTYPMGNRTFRCWKKRGHGTVDLHRAIVESCDVYFYHLGDLLGVDTLAKYAQAFGFGSGTGVSLPGEKSGLVPTREWKLRRFGEPWQRGETTSLAIGQGFALATPLQLLRAYCALANGGTLYKPWLVKRIETADGQAIQEFPPEVEGVVPVSRKNLDILRYALWGV
ncbi:MAG: penicillin-binding protein 2, partial [Syntrophaceae bacterium]|nr:penicillin-binding protein 2 [Syntrophaceae bacterium]